VYADSDKYEEKLMKKHYTSEKNLVGILFFCLAYRIFYFEFLHPNMILYNSDSVDYFASIDVFKGIVDLYRTPVYPYILRAFEYLSKGNFIRNLFLFQQIISFFSIVLFYFIAKKTVKNKYLIILTTIFYGCWRQLISQNVNINPECLCIVGSTFFLFLVVKYIETPTKQIAFLIGFFPFILIMLKPIYLISLCLVFLFFIARIVFLREKKMIYWGLLGWVIAFAGVLGYCEMNKSHHGEFVLSKIVFENSIAKVIISGAYKQGGDQELIAVIDSTKGKGFYFSTYYLNNEHMDDYSFNLKKFPSYLPPTDDMLFCKNTPNVVNYSYARMSLFVKKSQHSMVYFKYIIQRMFNILWAFQRIFILLFLELIILGYVFIKQNKIAWMEWLCVLFVVGQCFSILIGGIYDIGRMLIPSYPFILLLAASFLEILVFSLRKKKLVISI